MIRLITFKSKKTDVIKLGIFLAGEAVLDLGDKITMNDIITTGDLSIQKLKSLMATSDRSSSSVLSLDEIMILPPIVAKRNVMCIGKNYSGHVAEIKRAAELNKAVNTAGLDVPKHPVFFSKATGSVIGHGGVILNHKQTAKYLDYEAELAVIIGKRGRDIPVDKSMEHVFGYTIANDITARDLQSRHLQWFKGKSLDTSCPLGPCIVPACDIDPTDLSIKLWLNGELKQNARTSEMIFKIPDIISSLSQGLTLEPGDIILTGTPDGVGYAAKPPRTLEPGDTVKIEIEHIGVLENTVSAI